MAVEALWRSFRLALRHHWARPGIAAFSVAVLALGIGVTTATFALVRGVLLGPLPFANAEEVVVVGRSRAQPTGAPILSAAELQRLWEDARSFEELGAWAPRVVRLRDGQGTETVTAVATTPSLLRVLDGTPLVGRLLRDGDATDGAERVMLLSHGTWSERFAADPRVVGTTVTLDNETHVVVGVLPRGFGFTDGDTHVWTPLAVRSYDASGDDEMTVHGAFTALGRLRSGVTPQIAAAEVDAILRRVDGDVIGELGGTSRPRVATLREERNRPFRAALAALSVAAGGLLLMACANTAGLLLSQGMTRTRQMAVRTALGASRGQIVGQMLMESTVLALVGGAAATGLAAGMLRVAPHVVPVSVPRLAETEIDGGVILVAGALSLFAAGVAGCVPAIAVSRAALRGTLNEGSAAAVGGFGRLRVNRAHGVLAVAQVALAVVLLSASVLLLRSFVVLISGDLGFDPANVLATRIETPLMRGVFSRVGGRMGGEELEAVAEANRRGIDTLVTQLERIRTVPRVQAVAITSTLPLHPASVVRSVTVVGRSQGTGSADRLRTGIRRVTAGYADVVRLRLRGGRFLDDWDLATGSRVAVVSETFARVAFGDDSALGQRFATPAFGAGDWSEGQTWEVVGVVGDVESPLGQGIFERAPAGEIYLPMGQEAREARDPTTAFMQPTVVVRTVGDPSPVVPYLTDILAETHPRSAVHTVSLAARLALRAAQPRFYATCAGLWGAVALLLAATSLYGVLSFIVAQRRREIGLRVALGATPYQVVALVGGQGGSLILSGVVLGLAGATAAADVVGSVVVGVGDVDALTLTAVVALLSVVGLLACWFPARRAALVDPMEALRGV